MGEPGMEEDSIITNVPLASYVKTTEIMEARNSVHSRSTLTEVGGEGEYKDTYDPQKVYIAKSRTDQYQNAMDLTAGPQTLLTDTMGTTSKRPDTNHRMPSACEPAIKLEECLVNRNYYSHPIPRPRILVENSAQQRLTVEDYSERSRPGSSFPQYLAMLCAAQAMKLTKDCRTTAAELQNERQRHHDHYLAMVRLERFQEHQVNQLKAINDTISHYHYTEFLRIAQQKAKTLELRATNLTAENKALANRIRDLNLQTKYLESQKRLIKENMFSNIERSCRACTEPLVEQIKQLKARLKECEKTAKPEDTTQESNMETSQGEH